FAPSINKKAPANETFTRAFRILRDPGRIVIFHCISLIINSLQVSLLK
ncbi:MAG: hypothetical protein ACI85O_003779, partial [Saprospiraceae bacterium]